MSTEEEKENNKERNKGGRRGHERRCDAREERKGEENGRGKWMRKEKKTREERRGENLNPSEVTLGLMFIFRAANYLTATDRACACVCVRVFVCVSVRCGPLSSTACYRVQQQGSVRRDRSELKGQGETE